MPELQTPSACAPIASEVDSLEQERAALQQELVTAPPGLKPFLIREIRKIGLELAAKRSELRQCLLMNPPPPRPDLVPVTVLLKLNHATRKLGVAALIRNDGLGSAHGPFEIHLAVTLFRGGATTSIVRVFEVPAGVVLAGVPVADPNAQAALPGHGFTREYLTESMEVPLCYRDETPSCRYEFDMLVDAEHVVAESNEANNQVLLKWWTTTPGAARRETPFVIESEGQLQSA
ncbi:MAG: hypothetical protein R2762_22865 [Bryobacteraceae bacterium]